MKNKLIKMLFSTLQIYKILFLIKTSSSFSLIYDEQIKPDVPKYLKSNIKHHKFNNLWIEYQQYLMNIND
jgi:hypothetical protein